MSDLPLNIPAKTAEDAASYLQALIQAPEQTFSRLCLRRLAQVTEHLEWMGDHAWSGAVLHAWLEVLPEASLSDASPARGTWLSHPYHAALSTPSPYAGPPTQACERWTIALMATIRKLWPTGQTYSKEQADGLYRATLAMRKLLHDRHWLNLRGPAALPVTWQPFDLVRAIRHETLRRTGSDERQNVLQMLATFDALLATLCRRHRDTSGPEPAERARVSIVGLAGAFEGRVVGSIPPIWRLAGQEDGIVDDEDENEPDLAAGGALFEVEDLSDEELQDLVGDVARQQQLIAEIEMEEATRKTRPGRLTPAELATILRAVDDCPDLGPETRAAARASILAAGCFCIDWMRMSDQLACLDAVQWPSLQDASVRPAGLALYQDPGSMRWRGLQVVRSPMLPPPPLEADVTLLHPVRPQLIVPVNPAIAHALATSVLEIARTTWHFDQDGLRRLIWPAQALALTNYDRVLKHIQRALPGQRTDAGRLPWVMPTVLRCEIQADELTMGVLAGSGQVCSTAQYYQSIAVAPLVQQHARAQTIVATALGLQSPGAEEERVSDEGHRVGSLRVPRAQVMQQALKTLDDDVASHAAGWFDSSSRWVQYHNAQVNRWAFVLHAAFALRRSASALHCLVPDAVDMADGWIVLADKGLAERLLPLSDGLMRHWNGFGSHLQQLRLAAGTWRLDHEAVALMDRAWRDGRIAQASLQLLHVHEDQLVATPWHPRNLDHRLATLGIGIPTQLWRHAALTRWRESGVPADDIDALAGHYRDGCDPWNDLVMESSSTLIRRLAGHVEAAVAWMEAG